MKTEIEKCPKCGAKIGKGNYLHITQKFSTKLRGTMNENGNVDYNPETVDSGYNTIGEWIDNYLTEEGKMEIEGCSKCNR